MIFSQDFYFANIVIALPRDEVDLLEQFFLVIFERSHHFQGELQQVYTCFVVVFKSELLHVWSN